MKRCLLFLTTMLFFSIAQSQNLPRALIITGNGNIPNQLENYPPWTHEFHNDKIMEILKDVAAVDTGANLADLNERNLRRYALVISNSLFLTPSPQQLDALHNFVKTGKSYFTIHCGLLSGMNWAHYQDFIGGNFIGGPSTVPERFRVITSNSEFWGYPLAFKKITTNPISKTVADFDAKDELYYFEPSTKHINIIARAENHPVMWWNGVGKGKVMCLTLGHDLAAKENAGYQELLRNGVRWLTGAPLINSAPVSPVSDRVKTYTDFLKLAELSDLPLKNTNSIKIDSDSSKFILKQNHLKNFDLSLTGKGGPGRFTVKIKNKAGITTSRTFNIDVVSDGKGNLASYFGNKVTATASENASPVLNAANLIDGDSLSRWSSVRCEEAFVLLDLQKKYDISKIQIFWEAAYAKHVEILASVDEKSWNTVYKNMNGNGQLQEAAVTTTARYLKFILKDKPKGQRGFSIYELRVFK